MITVVFGTKNRAKLLNEVLVSYQKLTSPEGGWRLVVVDNGSADTTPETLYAFRAKLPITILRETRPGKNVALNTAISSLAGADLSDGSVVAFTDDDAFPWPDRLVQIALAAKLHRESSVFGGRIVPRWESPPPEWVLHRVPKGPVFSLTDESTHVEGPIKPGLIFGPNMAIRSEVLREGYRFDEAMGPDGTSNYTMGDETEFTRRLVNAGQKTWYCERAVVEHFIRSEQLRSDWILHRAIPFARGEYRLGVSPSDNQIPHWFGIPRYLYREIVTASLGLGPLMLFGDKDRCFAARWDFNCILGRAIEARDLRRRNFFDYLKRAPATQIGGD